MDLTDDKHPQFQVIFGKKYEHRDPENIDAEEFIAKKGYTAKGKKCHQYDLKNVRFIEPLDKPDSVEPESVSDSGEAGQPSGPGPNDVILSEAKDLTEPGPTVDPEAPIDIMPESSDVILSEAKDLDTKDLPDIDDLPDEGEFFEPTLF